MVCDCKPDVAPQLGYVVHWLQSEFPDCELMRRVGEDKSQPLKAEFEYESRNFLKHMHDIKGCDLIICWRHNWPECPLEVLELRKSIAKKAADGQSFCRRFAKMNTESKNLPRKHG